MSLNVMSSVVTVHVLTGLTGIVSGLVAVVGTYLRKRSAWSNGVFLSTTAVSCATGFAFLPAAGVTSAQLVAFFLTFLLAVAAYARYVRRLDGTWNQVYAVTAVGALFLNVLIATAQSFLHVPLLRGLAPTQQSPVYVAVKVGLLVGFIALAFVVTKRAGRS